MFCDRFLDCTFRPNLIQVPGKKGCLLISESGVIPLGETERIYSLVARERLLWDASGVFGVPGLLIILFGEQKGDEKFLQMRAYQNGFISGKANISKELNILLIFCQSLLHHSSPGMFQTDFRTKEMFPIKKECLR